MSKPPPVEVVVLTADQLRQIVRDAIVEAFEAQKEDPPAQLLDRSGIARVLGLSTASIDKLRKRGLPSIRVGDVPRFVAVVEEQWRD
ncbi:MAG TPA: hypothetical protein VMG12_36665 [Polyangiaceae bacterium]|nr:hypothetical protein [Polyangiaceae bacterium]